VDQYAELTHFLGNLMQEDGGSRDDSRLYADTVRSGHEHTVQ